MASPPHFLDQLLNSLTISPTDLSSRPIWATSQQASDTIKATTFSRVFPILLFFVSFCLSFLFFFLLTKWSILREEHHRVRQNYLPIAFPVLAEKSMAPSRAAEGRLGEHQGGREIG